MSWEKSCLLLTPRPRGGLCNLIKGTIKLAGTTFRCVVYPTKTYNAVLIVFNKSGILCFLYTPQIPLLLTIF